MDELIEVLDEKGNKTGIIKSKSQIKKEGDYHRAISVCLINDKKEILMHKRSKKKVIYPDLWSCFVRGHVQAYEESIDACIREIKEEIGTNVNAQELRFLYTRKEDNEPGNMTHINNLFFDNYICFKNIKLEDLKIEEEEISEIKYMPYQELEKLIRNNDNSLIPNYEDYHEIITLLSKDNL